MKTLFLFTLLILLTQPTFISAVKAAEQASKVTPVSTTKASQKTMLKTTQVRGEIESPSTPHIAANVAADVISIMVDEGMTVIKGQLLAELDGEAFKIAEEKANANIQRLQALNENQQGEVKRNKELLIKKLISQSVFDNVQSLMKQFQAELSGARAMLKEAQYQLSHTKILSPISGVIQQRFISTGDYVKVGNPIFHIVEIDKSRGRIYFPDSLSSSINIGMEVTLTKDLEAADGVITYIRPMMENGTRATHALVEFDNLHKWKPGTSISATTVLAKHLEAIAIPDRALVRRPAGIVVYRVEGSKVAEQIVTTGLKQNAFTEITTGIKAGETIVLDGAAWLTDGASVSIQKSSQ